jgi:hypothetical protein
LRIILSTAKAGFFSKNQQNFAQLFSTYGKPSWFFTSILKEQNKMNLQRLLTQIAKLFIKIKYQELSLAINPSYHGQSVEFTVVIEVIETETQKLFTGKGRAGNSWGAFLQALLKLGETIIIEKEGLLDQSAIASGPIFFNNTERVKTELVERDAFLFHYQNQIPFRPISTKEGESSTRPIHFFALETIDETYHSVFAIGPLHTSTKGENVVRGMGTHPLQNLACQKALEAIQETEYEERIQALCYPQNFTKSNSENVRKSEAQAEKLLQGRRISKLFPYAWDIETYHSPIRFFQYSKVTHPEISSVKFIPHHPSPSHRSLYIVP